MNNEEAVAGFQFEISGLNIIEASGGSAEANGFMMSASGSTVIGFSLTGSTIPASNGVLVNVSFNDAGEEFCLSDAILSGSSGNALDVDLGDCYSGPPSGCTDMSACNYDADAEVDDGSCDLPNGCGDPTAFNYDSTVTCSDPASCIAIVYGCTDPSALNYYGGANIDDGSCCYVLGCTDPLATNYDANACVGDGSCTYTAACSNSSITGLFISDIIDEHVFTTSGLRLTGSRKGHFISQTKEFVDEGRPYELQFTLKNKGRK